MKIAIVCDWLVTLGGAEKVLGELLLCYPDADVFAVVDFLQPEQRDFLQGKTVNTTFVQKLPFAKKLYRSYLPIMPFAIEQLDLSSYDLVISSSHAVAKGVMTGPDQIHISYIHSPMRYAWDLQHQYLQESGLDKKPQGWLARYFLHLLRGWDFRSAHQVDHLIANSKFIARRIQKAYRLKADVIYPPIDIAQFLPQLYKENFYLAASRLVPYKKMDLIVESFKDMPDKNLVVIGNGPDFVKVRDKAGANVKMLGYVPTAKLANYMQRAKALIFAAEEDFGLVPLEAQACGTPVIAFGKGGVLETVRGIDHPKPTGLFFPEQTTASICAAINQFESNETKFTMENCVANALHFRPEKFREQFKAYVAGKMKEAHLSRTGNGDYLVDYSPSCYPRPPY